MVVMCPLWTENHYRILAKMEKISTDSLKLSGINLNGSNLSTSSQKAMERDEQVTTPDCIPPVLNATGGFLLTPEALLTRIQIIQGQNERLARKMDAAHIIDELERGLYGLDEEDATEWEAGPFSILKAKWDNQAFHFRDEEK